MTEPTNADRAKRIELLHPAYPDQHDAQGVLVDHGSFVADVLADLRHYCDVHGLDFNGRGHLGHLHYTAEIDEAEDALRDPLDFVVNLPATAEQRLTKGT